VPKINSEFRERLGRIVAGAGGQSALSRKSGVSQRLISYYEKGRDPSAMAAVLIAAASGVSVDWLLTGSEPDLDIERLAMALEVFDEGLAITRRVIDNPRDRAEIIARLYQLCGEKKKPARATVIRLFGARAAKA
jgi:transcriptional regulator with XRE-family HTH domain